jgi:hypothetical protein
MELARDHIQRMDLILVVLNFRVLLQLAVRPSNCLLHSYKANRYSGSR